MVFLLLFYMIIQLGIGYYVSQKIKNSTDFFLAGRNMPVGIITISLVASWFGAETCIGSSGAVYAQGLSGSRADPFGYSLCLLMMGLFIAAPLWRGGYITLSDFFSQRFGSTAEKLSALILIPSSLVWGAAQVRAFGQVLSTTTEIPVDVTIIFCTVFVVFYTFLGGLLGDIINDVIQAVMIFIGLTVLLVSALYWGGFEWNWISGMNPERLSFLNTDETIFQRLDRWAIPILGSMIAQELISRTLASKSAVAAQRASYYACLVYIVLGSIPVFLGLIGPKLLPGIPHHEEFLSLLSHKYLNSVMQVILIGALISAILSTIDSIFLAIAAIASQNLIHGYVELKTEKQKLYVARLFVVMAAVISYFIAISADGFYQLVQMASSLGTAGIFVVTIVGLWTPWGHSWAAALALLAGLFFFPIAEKALDLQAPFLSTILVSAVFFICGTLIDQRKSTTSVQKTTPPPHSASQTHVQF